MLKVRVYNAEVVESMITALKDDYLTVMHKYMAADNAQKVYEMQMAITALGILEDRLYDLPRKEVDV